MGGRNSTDTCENLLGAYTDFTASFFMVATDRNGGGIEPNGREEANMGKNVGGFRRQKIQEEIWTTFAGV